MAAGFFMAAFGIPDLCQEHGTETVFSKPVWQQIFAISKSMDAKGLLVNSYGACVNWEEKKEGATTTFKALITH